MTQLTFFDDMDYTPIKPEEKPFDTELDKHLESLVEQDYLIHWTETEGSFQ